MIACSLNLAADWGSRLFRLYIESAEGMEPVMMELIRCCQYCGLLQMRGTTEQNRDFIIIVRELYGKEGLSDGRLY